MLENVLYCSIVIIALLWSNQNISQLIYDYKYLHSRPYGLILYIKAELGCELLRPGSCVRLIHLSSSKAKYSAHRSLKIGLFTTPALPLLTQKPVSSIYYFANYILPAIFTPQSNYPVCLILLCKEHDNFIQICTEDTSPCEFQQMS